MNTTAAQVGQQLPPLELTLTLPRLVAYAGATWDWHRYHYDADFARAAGLPAPFVDGPMLAGFLAKLVLDWAGPDARLLKLALRYRSMIYAGERIVCRGQVTAIEERNGYPVAICELTIEKGGGETVVRAGSAEVELPASGTATSHEPRADER